jgi:HEAT repeat protein
MADRAAFAAAVDRGEADDAVVEELGVPHRAQAAYWVLLGRGERSLPAVRAGLQHEHADVRVHCCRIMDHFLAPDALTELLGMLDDSDARVRVAALHSLACDRCKEGDCRPDTRDVLDSATRLLTTDDSPHVRAMAVEVAGAFVHESADALQALEKAAASDGAPAVRKKAGWYLPGGTIYERTRRHTG